MKVVRYADVEALYARVEPYLLPNEPTHNLIFGLLSNIEQHPARFPEALLGLVEDEGAIQLVALRTDPGHDLILSLAESPDAVTALAHDLHAAGLTLGGIEGPNAESMAFIEAWSRLSAGSYQINLRLGVFKLDKVNPVTGVAGHLRRAAPRDRDLLVQWDHAFALEAFPGEEHSIEEAAQGIDDFFAADVAVRGIYVWDDGGAVSYAAYKGPTPHGIRIGPVYTPPQLRGRGYASACVAGMSQYLLDSGRQFCFLFTDLSNPTSNHIYQVIGYEKVCEFTRYGLRAD